MPIEYLVKDCHPNADRTEISLKIAQIDASNEAFYQRLARIEYEYVPNILTVDGTRIFMQTVEGVTLRNHINNHPGDFRVVDQLLGAFERLRTSGLCHYDPNLDHYLIDRKGNVWIMDFSIVTMTTNRAIHESRLNTFRASIGIKPVPNPE